MIDINQVVFPQNVNLSSMMTRSSRLPRCFFALFSILIHAEYPRISNSKNAQLREF